jgi:hypothetical protein
VGTGRLELQLTAYNVGLVSTSRDLTQIVFRCNDYDDIAGAQHPKVKCKHCEGKVFSNSVTGKLDIKDAVAPVFKS